MFTEKEKKIVDSNYFYSIKEVENYMEFKSKSTNHCWLIRKNYHKKYFISIYHKHSETDRYYHLHYETYCVRRAIECILKHDRWVCEHRYLE